MQLQPFPIIPSPATPLSTPPETPAKQLTLRVYPRLTPVSSVSADSRVRDIARQLELAGNPEIINSVLYFWQNGNTTFEINRRTLTFNYQTDYLSNTEFLHTSGKTLPTSAEATRLVKEQLSALDLLPATVATTPAQVSYVKAIGDELIQVSTVDQADFVQVALQREPITQITTDDRCQEVTQQYSFVAPAGQLSAIIGIVGRDWLNQDTIVALSSTFEDYDWQNYSVYPARTLEEAWEVIQSGNAYVANLGTTSDVIIDRISLAYYEDSQEQSYLQPVYVFESTSGHKAYVPALRSSEFDTNRLLDNSNNNNLNLPSTYNASTSADTPPTSDTSPSPAPVVLE
jgi:hypothetical protein